MSQILTTFDPSATASGTFTNALPGATGTLVIYNDSGITIDVMWQGESKVLPAGMIDIVQICNPANLITWQQDYILTNVSNWPASIVKVVGYRPDEQLPYSAFPVPLQRTSNVGNAIPVSTSATSVQNDANAPGTQYIESTPNDQATSADKWMNDGSGTKKILSAGVQRVVESVTRGNATSGKATIAFGDAGDLSITTLHGTADQVPATGVQAGTLPAGVILPTAQLSGTINPATQVGNGALPAGVTSPNYMPFSGGTFTGNVTCNSSSTAQFDQTAIFDRAQGGSRSQLAQFESSDQSPAARWTISQNTDGTLQFTNETIGAVPLKLRGQGGIFQGVSFFTGGGSGTFSHGFGQTPSICLPMCTVSNSSQTMGYDSLGSSTVHITAGGALAFAAACF